MKLDLGNFGKLLVLSSSVALTACGGSGESSETQPNTDPHKEDAMYQIYYQRPNIFLNIIADSFEITKYSIKNDEIFFAKSHNQPLEHRMLTESKILEQGTLRTNSIKRITPTEWRYELTPELKQNLTFELVNLDGEKVFDRILPGYREYMDLNSDLNDRLDKDLIKFYQNYKDAVFPAHSFCYRLKETQWNQPYISYMSDFEDRSFMEQREQVFNNYDNLKNSTFLDKADYSLAWGKWHGFDWIFLLNKMDVAETLGIVGNTDNKTANAAFVPAEAWKVDQNIIYSKSQLKKLEANPTDNYLLQEIVLSQKLQVAQLEKGCFAFNTQAINAIQKLNLIHWKQGDSSGIGQFFGLRTWTYTMNE